MSDMEILKYRIDAYIDYIQAIDRVLLREYKSKSDYKEALGMFAVHRFGLNAKMELLNKVESEMKGL